MKLIIEDDEGRKTVVPVARDEITIGRNEQNLVRLTEKNVSRRHGRLLRENGHFYIEDMGSFTGIRVNGERIHGKHVVAEGDLIQISEYDLVLQAGPDDRPAPKIDDEAQARKMAETATIRLSDLRGDAGELPAQDVPEAKRPRLVGTSGTWRGKELMLDRSPIRIGRSDENDIAIDHPSISRKHVRLHLENGTWKVMDAESRNGVRVNGEPYAAIGLRHGDVIELGHLRFAFVEAGKPFKLPPEFARVASAAPTIEPRHHTALWVIAGVALVAALSGSAFLLLRHRLGGDEAVETTPDARAERKFALRAAEQAAAAHRYTEAVRHLEAARAAGASDVELKDLDSLRAEGHAEEMFREMESAAASQDWERARKLLEALSATQTHFGARAAEKADAIVAGYVNLHVAAAALMKGKDNAGCLAEAQLALAANPRSADAKSLVEACRRSTVQSASVAPSRPAATPRVPRGGDDEARKLLNEGNQKLIAQDPAGAIALYQKALAQRPGNSVLPGLYRSLGIAFTRQGNVEEGARYYKLYLPLCTNPAEKTQLEKVLAEYDARGR